MTLSNYKFEIISPKFEETEIEDSPNTDDKKETMEDESAVTPEETKETEDNNQDKSSEFYWKFENTEDIASEPEMEDKNIKDESSDPNKKEPYQKKIENEANEEEVSTEDFLFASSPTKKPMSIGFIDGWLNQHNHFRNSYLPSLENLITQLDNDPSPLQNQPNQLLLQQMLRKMFFIRTNTNENDFTVNFQLSHDKIRDIFCHFFDTRKDSHNVSIIFGTAMSIKDQTPQQIWRLNSLISSIQLSQASSVVGYALGWLDATETLLWAFCPERHVANDSYAVFTFDWNGFDYVTSKKNVHKTDQQRFIDRFKNLGLLNDEECEKYKKGIIITLTADEVADRIKQNNKAETK
jgi:hypothetical protein